MDKVNQDYWYNQWQYDFELHNRLGIKDVLVIDKKEHVSIYADTDSLFVSFAPAIEHCTWKNLVFEEKYINSIKDKFIIFAKHPPKFLNSNCVGVATNIEDFTELIKEQHSLLLIDGEFVKNWDFNKLKLDAEIRWNWHDELDLIQGMDQFRFGGYLKKCLEEYAASFGVKNKGREASVKRARHLDE